MGANGMQARGRETSDSAQSVLLIIGHGTSSNVGRVEFQETVDRVKALMPSAVVAAGLARKVARMRPLGVIKG